MNFVYLIILLVVYSTTTSCQQIPTQLYIVSGINPERTGLTVYNITNGLYLKGHNLYPKVGYILGLFQPQIDGIQFLVTNISNVNLYSYNYTTNSLEYSSYTNNVNGGLYNLPFQQYGYNPTTQSIYSTGGDKYENNVTIYEWNFNSHEFIINVLEVAFYVSIEDFIAFPPTGCYDPDTANYYIFYLNTTTTMPNILTYNMNYQTITNNVEIDTLTDDFVQLFFANGKLFSVQYNKGTTLIILYTIDTKTFDAKVVFTIKTSQYIKSQYDIYFSNNDNYVVFVTSSDSGVNIQYTVVDLNTYENVFQSHPIHNAGSYIYQMALV